MKALIVCLLCIYSILLPAQVFHKRKKVPEPRAKVYITGTWLVTKIVSYTNDTLVPVKMNSLESYYQFGDSTSHYMAMFAFRNDSVPEFHRQLFSDWHFTDSIGDSCWLDPYYLLWDGYYCPFEGNGGGCRVNWINDSLMIFSTSWGTDSYAVKDSLWLKKVSPVKGPMKSESKIISGEYHLADSIVPWGYVSYQSELTDSFCVQHWKRKCYAPSGYCEGTSKMKYHYENFNGKLMMVSDDRRVTGWICPINENAVWVCFSNDCNSAMESGRFQYVRSR